MTVRHPDTDSRRSFPERRFYGRRHGHRLGARRQKLVREWLPALSLSLDASSTLLDPASFFESAPDEIWLEIGFGGGEHLAARALENPRAGFIGCEPYLNGVASLLSRIEDHGLDNIRIYAEDARDILERLPPASIDKIILLYPDPWPKKRHKKRRFVKPENLELLATVLRDGGELRFASDIPDYVRWTLFQVIRQGAFEWQAERPGDWRLPPAGWPGTRYEAKAVREGRQPVYLSFRRKNRSSRP